LNRRRTDSYNTTRCRRRRYLRHRCCHLANWPKHVSDSAHLWFWPMKTWRHPQNRKYITYRIDVRGGPSHGQAGNMYTVPKVVW